MLSFPTHRWGPQHLWGAVVFGQKGDNSTLKSSNNSRHLQGLLQSSVLDRTCVEIEI